MELRRIIVMIGCKKCQSLCKENESYGFCKQIQPGLFDMLDHEQNGIDISGLSCNCKEMNSEHWICYDLTRGMWL